MDGRTDRQIDTDIIIIIKTKQKFFFFLNYNSIVSYSLLQYQISSALQGTGKTRGTLP